MQLARRAAIALTGAVMVGGLLTAASGSASAAPSAVTLKVVTGSPAAVSPSASCDDYYYRLEIIVGGVTAGEALFNADPNECQPGDYLGARDSSTDGYSVVARLSRLDGTVPDRVVTTSGHPAPYTVWAGGNLTEGHTYYLQGCVSKSGVESCTDWYGVVA
jgi:hypothetical protein